MTNSTSIRNTPDDLSSNSLVSSVFNNTSVDLPSIANHGPTDTISIIDNQKHYLDTNEFNKIKFNSKSLSIFSLNINSLRKHCDELVTFLNCLNSTFDIIILSEIRHNVEEILNRYFSDYAHHIRYPINNRCGGLAILIKQSIKHELIDDYCITHPLIENQVIKVKSSKGHTIISGVYKHPQLQIQNFKSIISQHIDSIPKEFNFVLVGDFNVDLLKINQNAQIREFYEKIHSLNCHQLIHTPTRINSLSKTLIDHVYIRCKSDVKIRRGTFINQISDHLGVFVTLFTRENFNILKRPEIRIFNEKNHLRFKNSLRNLKTELQIDNQESSNTKWNKFTDVIKNKFNEAFPIKQISRNRFKDKLWITAGLRKSACRKEKLYKTWRLHPTDANKTRYTTYKNLFNKLITSAKKQYFSNIFKIDKNSKKTWEEINKLTGKKASKGSIIDAIKYNDDLITDTKSISNIFNEYFSTIGEKMSSKYPSSVNDRAQTDQISEVNCSLKLNQISHEEIIKIISNLPNKSSCGTDNISQKLLKRVSNELTGLITELINLSIRDKTYPDCLKIAKIIPIHKAKNKQDCSNYRPISLLSVFNKIFEKVIHKDLTRFIEYNNILFINQFGFRKFHSTLDALTRTHDYIVDERRKGNKIIGIFLDLSKAFDSIDNEILIRKLELYGIRGPYNELIKSYLTDRKCLTQLGDAFSNTNYIRYGVPQGSILGPLLFSLYINDIKSLTNQAEVNLFADDTALFCTSKSYETLIPKCNEVLSECYNWLLKNKLTLNASKTHFVDFSKSQNSRIEKTLLINNETLSEANFTKYLGITLQHNLKWDLHINSVIKKLYSKIPLFYQIRNIMSNSKKMLVFNALSLPNIIYGIEIYARKHSTLIDRLQKAQNRILKILFYKNIRTSTNVLHKSLNVLKISELAKLRSALVGHRVIHDKQRTNIAHRDMAINDNTGRDLRRNNRLNFVISNIYYDTRNKVTEYAMTTWNDLPEEYKCIKNRNLFKNKIKSLYLSRYS